jgi:micrococcal nuclease
MTSSTLMLTSMPELWPADGKHSGRFVPVAGPAVHMSGPSRRTVAVLAIGLLAAAGCVGVVLDGAQADQPPDADQAVRVTHVVDGDTIDVRFRDGSEDRVRLVGVDTPEVHVATDPGEYPGVANTSAGRACLRAAGHDASNFTVQRVGGESVGLAYDPHTDRRGGYDRLLAYVLLDNESLNYELVRTGHARVYETEFTRRHRYEDAKTTAREAGRGLWGCAS